MDGLVVVDQTSFGASHSGCIGTEGRLLRWHMLAFPAQKLLELASALAYTDEVLPPPHWYFLDLVSRVKLSAGPYSRGKVSLLYLHLMSSL